MSQSNEILEKKVDRRTLVGGALGAAAALPLAPALTARASGSTRATTRKSAAQEAGKGGTLIVDLGSEIENLDPWQQLTGTTSLVHAQCFESLLRYKRGTLELEPSLALSWTGTEDGLSWTFELRQGVTFHDGTQFNAAAVVFNYERVFVEGSEFYATGQWTVGGYYDFIETVTADAEYTVTYKLNRPFNKFLDRVGGMYFVSPESVRQYKELTLENPVGTGPYKFDRWDKGQQAVYTSWEGHWETPGTLDQVVFKAIAEAGARAAALLSGETNMAVEISPEISEQLTSNGGFNVVAGPTGSLWFLAMNVEFEQFKDVRVRQAVNHAVDKDTIVSAILNNTAEIAYGPLSPAFTDYNPAVADYYPYDPEKAKALLAEAGYAGEEIVFRTSIGGSGMLSPEEMATFIQDNLREVGLETKIETIEFVSWMDAIRDPQNELTVMSWNIAPIEPDVMFNGILSKASLPPGFNTSYWVNDEFERLIEIGRTSLDPAEVHDAYMQAQVIVMDEAPIVPVCHRQQVFGLAGNVQNFQIEPAFGFLLKDVWIQE
jgi:peptide/nickel transport system substrate-binding protein